VNRICIRFAVLYLKITLTEWSQPFNGSQPQPPGLSQYSPNSPATLCSPLKDNWRFAGTCRLHLSCWRVSRATNQHEVDSKQRFFLLPDLGFKSYNIILTFPGPEGSLLCSLEPPVHLGFGDPRVSPIRSFFYWYFVCIPHLYRACYKPRPSHPLWFHQPNNTYWKLFWDDEDAHYEIFSSLLLFPQS
jgi:hypothetical protein